MELILLSGLVIFIGLYGREHYHKRILEKEILYLCEKIDIKLSGKENGMILLQTNNKFVKKLITCLNSSLKINYKNERDYKIMKNNMFEVLTNVSHDLRTPLTILKGYIEILQNKSESKTSKEESILLKLNNKIDETTRMLNQFFSMARIESGDMTVCLKKTNICELSGNIMLEYYDLLKVYNITVNIGIPQKPIWIELDEVLYERIIKNLIDNAIKYGRKGGYLGFLLWEDESCVSVEIEDHGLGISQKDIPYIFDRRYSVNNADQVKYESCGLGLYISKELAKKMNANITVNSDLNIRTGFKLSIEKR